MNHRTTKPFTVEFCLFYLFYMVNVIYFFAVRVCQGSECFGQD